MSSMCFKMGLIWSRHWCESANGTDWKERSGGSRGKPLEAGQCGDQAQGKGVWVEMLDLCWEDQKRGGGGWSFGSDAAEGFWTPDLEFRWMTIDSDSSPTFLHARQGSIVGKVQLEAGGLPISARLRIEAAGWPADRPMQSPVTNMGEARNYLWVGS